MAESGAICAFVLDEFPTPGICESPIAHVREFRFRGPCIPQHFLYFLPDPQGQGAFTGGFLLIRTRIVLNGSTALVARSERDADRNNSRWMRNRFPIRSGPTGRGGWGWALTQGFTLGYYHVLPTGETANTKTRRGGFIIPRSQKRDLGHPRSHP